MGQQQKTPDAPNMSADYARGMQVYLKYLPRVLRQEEAFRTKYDPKRVADQQALQARYGPTQYAQQLAALRQIDPTGVALRESLGRTITGALGRGYLDPQQAAAFRATGKSVTGDVLREGVGSPQMLREIAQAGLSRRGQFTSGGAPEMASRVYTGARLQQAKSAANQAGMQYASLQSPYEKTLAQAGSFLSSATPEQRIGMIQGVSPDRANAYVNPNAGYLGAQYGLQNYQNQLGQSQLGGQNPWSSALGTIGGVAGTAVGSYWGGPVGGAAGGAAGGATGSYLGSLFSDSRLKQNISRTGQNTRDGIALVEFDMFGKRYRGGVIAQEVLKQRPDAVGNFGGFLTVNYRKLGLREPMEKEAI